MGTDLKGTSAKADGTFTTTNTYLRNQNSVVRCH